MSRNKDKPAKKPTGGLIGRTVNRAISDSDRAKTAERERKEREAKKDPRYIERLRDGKTKETNP
jgi:hypothetical protein